MFFIGLHFEEKNLHVAVLTLKKKTPSIVDTFDIDLTEDCVKPFYMIPEKYLKNSAVIASGLPAEKTMLRTKDLHITAKKDLQDALPFQLEELIPYPPQEVLSSVKFLKKKKITTLQVIGTQKKDVKEHLEHLHLLGIEPDFVGSQMVALAETTRYLQKEKGVHAAFCLEKEKALFILFEKEQILFSHTIFLESSSAPIKEVLSKHLLRLSAYLKDKNLYLSDQIKLSVFCKEAPLQKFIAERLSLLLSDHKEEEQKMSSFCIAIGLALQAQKKENNFRDTFFISPKIFSQRKKIFLRSAALSLSTALFLFSANLFYTHSKEKQFSTRFYALLNAPYKKHSFQELETLIEDKEKAIRKEKPLFKVLFDYPTASDILAWLSVHPILCERDEVSGEGVDIREFHYTLEEKSGEIQGACVKVSATFPNPSLLARFRKSIEKELLFKKVEFVAEPASSCFVFHLHNKSAS